MSRAKLRDNSTAVSLFPFLAVLLCTMGALLVVLVAVSRTASDTARRQAETQRRATVELSPESQQEIQEIGRFQANLQKLRSEAEERLREDQLRLGHLENHMRRLQDQLALLQAAAMELDAMEEEHYDDREQAEREVERLERLVAETREAVEALKEENASKNRSYAIIPYEGPNGTYRRPIYIECLENELVLQPEGVRVKREDLYPPYGSGNPLAAAIRAARDYYSQLHPQQVRSRDTEPYPLLVVRPQGLVMYDKARRTIENSDLEFGFELVEEDWELEFPVADPQLATLEQQSIDQARIRQRALAAAAPRAYRQPALMAAGRFDMGEGETDGFGHADEVGTRGSGFGGSGFGVRGSDEDESTAVHQNGSESGESGAETQSELADAARGHAEGTESESSNGTNASGSREPSGSQAPQHGVAASSSADRENGAQSAGGAAGGSSAEASAGSQVNVSTGSPNSTASDSMASLTQQSRDWALDRKKPNAVPIRRTIQVVVRGDHVAILAEDAKVDVREPSGRRVEIKGDTVESLESIVEAVSDHIDGWGFAGQGLYWRPVLMINIGPGGERRSKDLTRLLENSGLELRTVDLASKREQGKTRATR